MKKAGYKLEFTFFAGGGPSLNEALVSDELDVVTCGDLPAFVGKSNGVDTTLIASVNANLQYGIVVAVADDKIQDAKDKAADYASQIAASEKELEDLLARQRADDGDAGMIYPTSGEYAWPLPVKGSISSRFGPRTAPTRGASTYHKGLDISVPAGTSVLAAKDGKVVIAQYSATAGNYIGISHGGGVYTYYMHNSRLLVKVGDKVKQGQVISKSGNTGVSTGPHLHFAVFAAGNYVNPEKYIKQPK